MGRGTGVTRSGGWSTGGPWRTWRGGAGTASGYIGHYTMQTGGLFGNVKCRVFVRFYAAKDEETDSDSDEEEDEVLDFHKQKSEVIFWNDPRIR